MIILSAVLMGKSSAPIVAKNSVKKLLYILLLLQKKDKLEFFDLTDHCGKDHEQFSFVLYSGSKGIQ